MNVKRRTAKRVLAAVAGLSLLALSSVTFAEEVSVGTISFIDEGSLMLEDGTTFTIGEGISVEGLEPGTEVTVSYEDQDDEYVATSIEPTE